MVLSHKKSLPIIILCGGKGTRIRELFSETPKGLIDINGKNVISTVIENDFFSDIYLAAGHLSDAYIKFIKNYEDKNIKICVESNPLGTGGAINNIIHEFNLDEFFVINGDTFIDIDFNDFFNVYIENNKPLLAIYNVEKSSDYGTIQINDQNDIISFKEKLVENETYAYAGLSILSKDLFSSFQKDESFSLEEEIFNKHAKRLHSYKMNKPFYDIGTPDRYKKAKKDLL